MYLKRKYLNNGIFGVINIAGLSLSNYLFIYSHAY